MRQGQSSSRSGGEFYWRAIRKLAELHREFTVSQLWDETCGVSRMAPANYVRALEREGHVRVLREERGGGRVTKVFALVTDSARPPVLAMHAATPAKRQQLWTAMRALRRFTIRELAVTASTEALAISPSAAQGYCRALARAGYLASEGRTCPLVYRLRPSANTGPRAPNARYRTRDVFDANLDRVVNPNDFLPVGTVGRAA